MQRVGVKVTVGILTVTLTSDNRSKVYIPTLYPTSSVYVNISPAHKISMVVVPLKVAAMPAYSVITT